MDFARKQLEKYGWAEGKGLGKQENGMKDALKPKPKRGTGGIGHDIAEEFTNDWWNKVYNNASNNIEVIVNDDGVSTLSSNLIKSSKKKKSKTSEANDKKPLYFTNFVKTATLTNGTTENLNESNSNDDESKSSDDEPHKKRKKLSDEELFEACGGRTAHKGARHGLKSNGKLSRIAQQEKIFLENYHKLKSIKSNSDIPDIDSKIKKKKKKSVKCKHKT